MTIDINFHEEKEKALNLCWCHKNNFPSNSGGTKAVQPPLSVTGPGSHRWLWRCFAVFLCLSSVKFMVCDHIVPSIQDLAFKDCAEGLASKPESYREPKNGKYNSRWFISAWQHRSWPAPKATNFWAGSLSFCLKLGVEAQECSKADPHVHGSAWGQNSAPGRSGPQKGEERPSKAKSNHPKWWEWFWKLNNGVQDKRSGLAMQKCHENLHLHTSPEAGWWDTPALITLLQRWFSLAPKGLKYFGQATSVSCWG